MRFDDVRHGEAKELRDPAEVWTAGALGDVRDVVRAADAARRRGRWVAGFLTYEAGAAFDASLPARPCASSGLPLAWFASFDRCESVAPVGTLAADEATVRALRRVPGSAWFRQAVERVRSEIAQGNVYQVSLSDRFRGQLVGDPFDLYVAMATAQRGGFHAFIDLSDRVIVSASPEQFLEWDGDVVSRPMKGTARRAPRPDDDERAARALAASEKDRAENVMIVDLLRNDLGRIAVSGAVRVPALFEVERYETVWQLTSTVTATPRAGLDLDELLAATFPCGSVTGAPKKAAMTLIDELEPDGRGIHAGAIGLLSPPGRGPRARFSVAIRTAVVERGTGSIEYGAGAGITWSSDAAEEDREVDAKAEVLRARWPRFQLLETMRLEARGARHLDLHLDRLSQSAAWFGYAFDRAQVAERIAALGRPREPCRLRVLVSRGGAVEIETSPIEPGPQTVQLAIARRMVRSDDVFCLHKTTHRATYDAARASCPHVDDVVLVNERGEAVETTVANLLFRDHGRWWTPPLSCGGLAGIGRARMLSDGLIGERVVAAVDLIRCEDLAVVSSLRGVRPAVLVPA